MYQSSKFLVFPWKPKHSPALELSLWTLTSFSTAVLLSTIYSESLTYRQMLAVSCFVIGTPPLSLSPSISSSHHLWKSRFLSWIPNHLFPGWLTLVRNSFQSVAWTLLCLLKNKLHENSYLGQFPWPPAPHIPNYPILYFFSFTESQLTRVRKRLKDHHP